MKNLLNYAIACAIVMMTFYNCSVEPIETTVADQTEVFTIDDYSEPLLDSSDSQEDSSDPQQDCLNQDPQARITNNGTITISLQIASIDGTILHQVDNIMPGDASGFLTFAPDDIIFNVDKNATGIQDDKVVFTMGECTSYDMVIGADNYLVAGGPENL